jgi:aspartate/methionine/tyrosine aminotransferase
MALTISARQRDALYDQILAQLSGIGDVWIAVCAEDYDVAERLGRDYSDDLRLVSEDLGWGEGSGGSIELSTPPDVLRRALRRLRDAAVSSDAGEEEMRKEVREAEERNRLVVEACENVLAGLGERQGA